MRFRFLSKRSFPEENKLLQTIPGVSEACAATILAEIGPNVDAFKSDGYLASWAGLCPSSYASSGIKNPHISHKEVVTSNTL
ncbi:transposase [Streptococcus pluranimalium]|uniref:transposase n=1 Tax=Streptococcus pluranimalium TaxID=82348 RepID=UPI003F6915F3